MALSGKKIVFTGTLTMQRAAAADMAKGAGANVQGSVSSTTDIVVAGPDAANTSKCLAAKAKGTAIWTEEDFRKALAGRAGKAAAEAPAAPEPRAAARAPAAPTARAAAKAPAAAALKRPAAAAVEDTPPPKRATRENDGDAGAAKPLHGQVFFRSGSHNFNAALGKFVLDLGGQWTKNMNQATYCFDGITIMRESYHFAKPYINAIEGNKPIVVVPLNFTRGKPTPEDTRQLLKAMKEAEAMLPKIRKEGMSSETIAAMYRKVFKGWFPTYYNDILVNGKNMYEEFHKSFEEAHRKKTGSYGVLKSIGGKLKFEIIHRGK